MRIRSMTCIARKIAIRVALIHYRLLQLRQDFTENFILPRAYHDVKRKEFYISDKVSVRSYGSQSVPNLGEVQPKTILQLNHNFAMVQTDKLAGLWRVSGGSTVTS